MSPDYSKLSNEELLAIAGVATPTPMPIPMSTGLEGASNEQLLAMVGEAEPSLWSSLASGTWDAAKGLGTGVARGVGLLSGLVGDVVELPVRLGYRAATGEPYPYNFVTSDMENVLSLAGLPRETSLSQRIGENIIPIGSVGRGVQVVAGALAGAGSHAAETLFPESKAAAVALPLAGAFTPMGLEAAARGVGLWAPKSAANMAKDATKTIEEFAPGSLTSGKTVEQRTAEVTASLEKTRDSMKSKAQAMYAGLPEAKVHMDEAIENITKRAEELEGPLNPDKPSWMIVDYLKRLVPREQVVTTPPSTLVDEAGRPLIPGSTTVIPPGPAVTELQNVQNILRDINALADHSTGSSTALLATAKKEVEGAIKKSVDPETFALFESAKAQWAAMKTFLDEGAAGAVREAAMEEGGNLNTLQQKLLSNPKSTAQLMRLATPEDITNLQGLAINAMVRQEPTTWNKFIAKNYDSFAAMFGQEGASNLLKTVSRDGSVGRYLLESNQGLSTVFAKLGLKTAVGGAIGYEAGGTTGAVVGAMLGASGARRGMVTSRAREMLLHAAAGDPRVVTILNQPKSSMTMPALIKALQGTVLGAMAEFAPTAGEKPMDANIEALIQSTAAETGIDSALMKAIVEQESSGNPEAKSSIGALGLMQLMPKTAEDLAKKLKLGTDYDLTDPYTNLKMGATYFKALLDKYGDTELALTAYHSGPGRVDALLKSSGGSSLADILSDLGPVGKQYAAQVLGRIPS